MSERRSVRCTVLHTVCWFVCRGVRAPSIMKEPARQESPSFRAFRLMMAHVGPDKHFILPQSFYFHINAVHFHDLDEASQVQGLPRNKEFVGRFHALPCESHTIGINISRSPPHRSTHWTCIQYVIIVWGGRLKYCFKKWDLTVCDADFPAKNLKLTFSTSPKAPPICTLQFK